MVGVNEDTDRLGNRLLLPQFLGTAGSKVGDAGAQGFTMPGKLREVQMLFFLLMSSIGMQSMAFSSFQVRMATTLFKVVRTHDSARLAKSKAVLMPEA